MFQKRIACASKVCVSMPEKISIPISVSYDKATRRGLLENLNLSIFVDDRDHSPDAAKLAMSIKHKNYLKCHFGVHENINRKGKTTHPAVMVHRPPGVHLKQHLQTAGESIITYTIPAIDASGKLVTDPYTWNFLPNFYRKLFRSMIRFMNYLHEQGTSIGHLKDDKFNLENDIFFDVTNEEIEFFGLDLTQSTPFSMQKDFVILAELIKEIIKLKNPKNLEMPTDMNHLLEEMKFFTREMTPLLENHLAILSTDDRVGLIRNFVWKGKCIETRFKPAYNDSIRSVEYSSDNSPDWTARFNGSDPKVGPVADCFAFCANHNGQRYVGVVNHNFDEFTVNNNLLWFCRNQVEHLNQHLSKHKSRFSSHDIDMILMKFFSIELLSFQKKATENNILWLFL